jgi:hypothetical protein
VPEAWRYTRDGASSTNLQRDHYEPIASSVVLLGISLADLEHFVDPSRETTHRQASAGEFAALRGDLLRGFFGPLRR